MTTNPNMPSPLEQEHLLYDDAAGERVGQRAVSAMDPVPAERVPRVRLLLAHPNILVVFEAARVLASWGDPVGLNKLEEFIDIRVDRLAELYPHSIYGYDNVYDVMANSLSDLHDRSNDDRREQRQRIFEKLLMLYGEYEFRDELKAALLECDFPQLEGPIDQAITRAFHYRRPYLASQLLPPLARFNPARAVRRFPEFSGFANLSPNPEVNVAEALAYVPPEVSRPQLEKLAKHRDKVIAQQAKTSLAKLPPG